MDLVKLANFFGMFNKIRIWLQGKKTYLAATIKALTAIGVMLTTLGTMFGILSNMLSNVLGWATGDMDFNQLSESIKMIVSNHTIMFATLTASWWALIDAFSDASKYAAANRRQAQTLGKENFFV